MFTCDRCETPTGPGISPIMVIVETRPKIYTNYMDGRDPIISKGWEIAKEIRVCEKCAGILKFIEEAEGNEVNLLPILQ